METVYIIVIYLPRKLEARVIINEVEITFVSDFDLNGDQMSSDIRV